MSSYKVLIADAVNVDCDALLLERGIEITRAVGVSRDELMKLLPEFDGMIVRSAVTVDRDMISAMSRMQAIGRAGVGVDNIDVEAATERGIVVMNTPDGNTISATEHTVAMLFALLRKIPAANASLRSGVWDRKSFTGTELLGKRVGVLGLGRIGREVARRLQAFDTTVIGYDPLLSAGAVSDLGILPATIDELIETSDIITLHIPLLPETRGLLAASELARTKKGAFIINCARGGIVDEKALLEALDSGQIGGAALDVFDGEPPTFPSPLIEHARVVATPHIAASTSEAQLRVAIDIATQVADFFEGKGARGVVNAAGLEGSFSSDAQPVMLAAARLGAFLGQLVDNHDVTCKLTAYGPATTPIVRGLGAAFLAGIIGLGLDGTVNAINAGMLAERNCVKLTTEGAGAHDRFTTLITAEVVNGKEKRCAAVTLYGHSEPHLVMVDNMWFDIRPEGDMILLEHRDRPGVLAAIGTSLASHNINIADVSLGRREGTGQALTIMRLDEELSDAAVTNLGALNAIERVRTLHFRDL